MLEEFDFIDDLEFYSIGSPLIQPRSMDLGLDPGCWVLGPTNNNDHNIIWGHVTDSDFKLITSLSYIIPSAPHNA